MRAWIKAGFLGAFLEIAFSLPSYMDHFLPSQFRMIVELLSCLPSILYCILLPFVGVLAGMWIVKPTTYRNAIIQGAAAGLLASILDHTFTVLLRIELLASGNYENLFSPPGWSALRSELFTSSFIGLGVIFAGTIFGILGSVLYISLTKSAMPAVGVRDASIVVAQGVEGIER